MDKAVALFDPDTLADDLTPGGLRYLTHAIRPGTPIASAAVLTFSGKVRLKPTGPWMPFRATETIHAGCSFRVTANARRGPIRATIEDTYDSTGARARVHAFGIIPVRSQSGPGPHPFARGRLAVESTWLPSAFLPVNGVRWQADHLGEKVTVPVHGDTVEAILRLGPEGELAAFNCSAGVTSPVMAAALAGSPSLPRQPRTNLSADTPSPPKSRLPGDPAPGESLTSSMPTSKMPNSGPSAKTRTEGEVLRPPSPGILENR